MNSDEVGIPRGRCSDAREEFVIAALSQAYVHVVDAVHERAVAAGLSHLPREGEIVVGRCLGRLELAAHELDAGSAEQDVGAGGRVGAGADDALDRVGLGCRRPYRSPRSRRSRTGAVRGDLDERQLFTLGDRQEFVGHRLSVVERVWMEGRQPVAHQDLCDKLRLAGFPAQVESRERSARGAVRGLRAPLRAVQART